MNSKIPNNSSSRAGRFKKKLVSENFLKFESQKVLISLSPFIDLHQSKKISDAEFVCSYILIFLSNRYPNTFLGAYKKTELIPGIKIKDLPFDFQKNIIKKIDPQMSLVDLFAQHSFKSTPYSVNRALVEWGKGNYGLELMFKIPKPLDVLKQQIMGRRCVTTISDERLQNYILGERDALSFTMHDLIHADHFYFHNESFEGQVGFYNLLYRSFDYFDLRDKNFADEFDYLISDMNAYAVHLMKCLKSAMIHYFDEDYFREWLKLVDAPVELTLLNTTKYQPESMDLKIILWLKTFIQSPLSIKIHAKSSS
jgi:hypothetical protein